MDEVLDGGVLDVLIDEGALDGLIDKVLNGVEEEVVENPGIWRQHGLFFLTEFNLEQKDLPSLTELNPRVIERLNQCFKQVYIPHVVAS